MKQLITSILLAILMSMVGKKVYAYDFEVNGIYYSYSSYYNSALVTSGDIKYSGSIEIPSTVTYNGRTLDVTHISQGAFSGSTELTSISIPNSIKGIDWYAFEGCNKLSSITIPSSVEYIYYEVFKNCSNLTTLIVEDGYNSVSTDDRSYQRETSSLFFPKYIYYGRNGGGDFYHDFFCNLHIHSTSIQVLSFGPYLTRVNPFQTPELKVIYCMSETPAYFNNSNSSFGSTAYVNAVLYVPIGAKEKYAQAEGWKNFFNIKEMDVEQMWKGVGTPNIDSDKEKCATPKIGYQNGKLTFSSDTKGAICHSTITDDDIKSYDGNEVQLGITYNIRVYATKDGYENSETATATLCWVDEEPKKEGISDGMAQMAARALMVKAEGGQMSIEGVEDNIEISVYSIDGVKVGSTTSKNGVALINTSIYKDSVAIVKIGNKSFKVKLK